VLFSPATTGSHGLSTPRSLLQNAPVTPPPSSSTAQTLQDFEPLLLAELIVLRAAADGSIAKVGYRRPRNATPDVRLRAEFLAFLAQGGGTGAPVVGGRLQVLGACIVGRLDLSRTRVPISLWLYRCVFGTAPIFDGAYIAGSLSMPDTGLPGLHAQGTRIDGELALNAGCSVHGELDLARAVIGRDLNCERLHLVPSDKFANTLPCRLIAENAQIGGDVILSGGADIVGELRLQDIRVRGDLRISSARLSAGLDASGARGVALNLDRARIGGHLMLDAGFSAAGQVRLQRARIGGDLDATGADFDAVGDAGWGDTAAVLLDRAKIGGALVLTQLLRPLEGTSLVDARVGTLRDDAMTWGTHHVLDGFAFKRFGGEAPTDATMRLGWLATQRASPFGDDYRPEPWRQVIKVLRRMGRDSSASEVAIGREHYLRHAGLIGLGLPSAMRWLARAGHALYGLLAGYGHRPLRLLFVTGLVWLACTFGLTPKLTGLEAACGWFASFTLLWIASTLGDRDRRV